MKKNPAFILMTILIFLAASMLSPAGAISLSDLPLKRGSGGAVVFVVQKKLNELGFFNFRPTGYFGDMTRDAVMSFQRKNSLKANGIVDAETYSAIFSKNALRAGASSVIKRKIGPRIITNPSKRGELMEWSEVLTYLTIGKEARVYDFYTGYEYSIVRVGGENHADVVPASDEDYKMFLKTFGGSHTWEKRPVVITVDGHDIAASVFGALTRKESNSSFIDGTLCFYFHNSTSDIGGLTDSEHITNIYMASKGIGSAK